MADKEKQEPTKEYLVHQNGIIDKGYQELNDELEKKVSDNRKLLNTPRPKSIETTVPGEMVDMFDMIQEHRKLGPLPTEPCVHTRLVENKPEENEKCVDHYKCGGYVCKDVMNAVFTEPMKPSEGFYLCNAFKYLWRCQHKGQYINDIKKVYDYMGYILQMYENGLGTFQEPDDDDEE